MNIDQIIDDFDVLDSWDDRYRYVIELGRKLPPLPEADHNEKNKVLGCASQVWLVSETKPGPNGPMLELVGDSDAHIVKGLIAILFALYSGKPARKILDTDALQVFQAARAWRASHAATLERFSLDGRSHSRRRGSRARPRRLISFAMHRGPRIRRAPMAGRDTRRSADFGADAVMAREAIERKTKHDLRGALRPVALALDELKPFQETAHIEQHAREFRPDGIQRRAHALFAASTVSLNIPALVPPARFPCAIGATQFDVTRGVRPACVKSARRRSPA